MSPDVTGYSPCFRQQSPHLPHVNSIVLPAMSTGLFAGRRPYTFPVPGMPMGFFSLRLASFAVETVASAYRMVSLYSTRQCVEGSEMKRVKVAITVLLLSGLIISASGAFGFPSSLSPSGVSGMGSSLSGMSSPSSGLSSLGSVLGGLGGSGTPTSSLGGGSTPSSSLGGLSTPSSSLGSSSMPSSNLQVSTPSQSAFGNWNLNNMKFFSPDNRASAQPVSSIPESDYGSIMQALGSLPTQDQMSQYYGGGTATATPAPNATETDPFISEVSSTIPPDQVIFIEVSKNTMLIDPTNQGIILPNVTMNYKFSDSAKKLVLKRKAGVNYNGSQLYFGYANSDDVNNKYVYDYSIGSSLGESVQVLFTGSDGRVRITVNGVTKDLKPGEKYETISDQGGQRNVLDVTNWGLISKANIEVADTI
jgi:hypothetical protein